MTNNLDNYRIIRVPKNLVIQRKTKGGNWKDVSYHGSSVSSLAAGLIALIGDKATITENQDLLIQAKVLRAEITALKIELEELITERMKV